VAQRREVVVSDLLIANAQAIFPLGGSAVGNPSYQMFEDGPLAAAKELFSRRFEESPEALEGTGIKVWLTIDLPFFPPLAFFAALVTGDDGRERVELVDVTIEDPQDYWALVEDDPRD
jgi:hypothetical protein